MYVCSFQSKNLSHFVGSKLLLIRSPKFSRDFVIYGFAAEQNGFRYTLIPTLTLSLTITPKLFITLTTTLTLTRARNIRIRVQLAFHVTKTVFCP